jgi:molybdopterin-containing oxidoreductase family iron-sulfur binding subunit
MNDKEFPPDFWKPTDTVTRRHVLKLMGASLSMAGLAACRKPLEEILPYSKTPEHIVPGKPLYFSSALPFAGYARGVLVTSHEGRPTKIEGHPGHPASLGATDVFGQAAILDLYDPDRSQAVMHGGRVLGWDDFDSALAIVLRRLRSSKGAGLRILTETVTSPTLSALLAQLGRALPESRWHVWEPAGRANVRAGARLAFGRSAETYARLDQAEVIVSLDSDFLFEEPASLRYVRQFADRRAPERGRMARLYVAEPAPTITGSMADHRSAVPASEIGRLAAELLHPGPSVSKWAAAVAKDLSGHRGRSVVLAGPAQPPGVHALAHALNDQFGNLGKTVVAIEPVAAGPEEHSLKELAEEMRAGKVELLLILGGNPAYSASADLSFSEALARVPMSVRLGTYYDETSKRCTWHVPEAHPLETWGDLRAFDGTASIQQPLIAPLYGGKTAIELLSHVLGRESSAHDLVRETWRGKDWRKSVHDGVVAGTESKPVQVKAKPQAAPPRLEGQGLEASFRPDRKVWDGRHANNGWLQELPDTITRVSWDNLGLLGAATAARLGLENGDLVEFELGGRKIEGPVWVAAGHAEDSVTLPLGYGRTESGRVGSGVGFDAYRLRLADASFSRGLGLRKLGKKANLAVPQLFTSMEGRDFARGGPLEAFLKRPDFAQDENDKKLLPVAPLSSGKGGEGETMYFPFPPGEYAWGMAIDLNRCIGCQACVLACQSENNIAVVGKEETARGRFMHWIRVDRYFEDKGDSLKMLHQPVPCMHCENAPCEIVCPVEASVHDDEGLNVQVYNRCVGTRYCSNNCPYKVRRFNFFMYTDQDTEQLKMQRNPNVSVRNRGVMEKCTYCTQRINAGRIAAEKDGRRIKDGEVVPACAQACPAKAISFGDLRDADAEVSKWKAQPRNYGLLAELGVRPRTTYLARIENPSPELEGHD